MTKPSIPKGTRDFGPTIVKKRQYIIDTIRTAYEQFGYQPIETPVMEKLSTLMGKYGEEGDKLLFRVLNQGDFLTKVSPELLATKDSKKIIPKIAGKGLRYDLTIPFARYVVMNQSKLTFPFKRYQIQPVWRGDRPQKGRYREFFQCDADVVGTDSLLNEVEFIQLYDKVYTQLGIEVTICLNNRKILAGLAEVVEATEQFTDITVAIDKLDKVGIEGVEQELVKRELSANAIEKIKVFLSAQGSNKEKIALLKKELATSPIGQKGVEELETIFSFLQEINIQSTINLDITLARGLNYYTGTILEVRANKVKIGSIGGGGRYDDLTGTFGLKDVSGVGISFGLDRIYDVMEESNLFQEIATNVTKVLFINFGEASQLKSFQYLQQLRAKNIPAEIYPNPVKMKKQMKYANAKQIPFVIFVGSEELENNLVKVKNMETGEQTSMDMNTFVASLL